MERWPSGLSVTSMSERNGELSQAALVYALKAIGTLCGYGDRHLISPPFELNETSSMDDKERKAVLELYPEFRKVYGPYLRNDGRNTVVFYDGKRQTSKQLARVRLEVKLGRRLTEQETVDHIDENYGNDHPDNLQVLSKSDNAAKSHRKDGRYVRSDNDQVCVICQTPFRIAKPRQTCGSSDCKTENKRRISLELGLKPPAYRGKPP